ncbi:hypothetical protein ASPZODRAFT_17443 [Penicilliopsis zonata CBS 506.65]|uniref:Zn(2)-C6 fungal-type domain-containing protein n=1 Tax=Penicilliopsis zonata CBS 506.65 TaxID=1073090 RepID=A0A1L9SDE9_9EURO|nr:hypothetical protein ASPZODRAFT_17443 [Penicilliopsis zonata CBS 506.65]OJJ45226.1 hypothetical protein ASPZODRAFT_17443 [Penicilliopsis zonata CBS 506.65]
MPEISAFLAANFQLFPSSFPSIYLDALHLDALHQGEMDSSTDRPVRKRRRPAYSCSSCRRRKVRCDRMKPCGQCSAQGIASCSYEERGSKAQPRSNRRPVQNESPRGTERSSTLCSTQQGTIRGMVSKTRVYGQGHWMNVVSLAEELASLQPVGEYYEAIFDGQNETIAECKRLARVIKAQRPSRKTVPLEEIHRFFPSRAVMDALVETYFSTFESCYPILHRQTFMGEYEKCLAHSDAAEGEFLLQLLLIMTIAGPMHSDPAVCTEIAGNSRVWINLTQDWLSGPLEKDRLTLAGLQLHFLLLLARQVVQVGADLVWISAGSLIRMAMQMGLHQDPQLLGGEMDAVQAAVRRRLWYTILEMNVQAALDSGMSPMISVEDYTVAINENNECDRETGFISLQPVLAKSLPLRLKTVRVINSLHEEPSYDQVLSLGNELSAACREASLAIETAASNAVSFASTFCNHLLRRFVLCLHFFYAIKARVNPLYSHSRTVCLDAALDLVSLLHDARYSRILITGGGMFRDIITRGVLAIFLELGGEDTDKGASQYTRERQRSMHGYLLRDARTVLQYARERMNHGETNVKTYVFLSMLMARAEAGTGSVDEAVKSALHASLQTCLDMLERAANTIPTLDWIDFDLDFDMDSLHPIAL